MESAVHSVTMMSSDIKKGASFRLFHILNLVINNSRLKSDLS